MIQVSHELNIIVQSSIARMVIRHAWFNLNNKSTGQAKNRYTVDLSLGQMNSLHSMALRYTKHTLVTIGTCIQAPIFGIFLRLFERSLGILFNRVYLNKKLFHNIAKYTRYSALFKHTNTICSIAFKCLLASSSDF